MTDLERAVRYIQSIGRCGSLSKKASICTRMTNHEGNHKAQEMSGPRDGHIYEEWVW